MATENLNYNDNINLNEGVSSFKISESLNDSLTLSDSISLDQNRYRRWFFSYSLISNFSFEDDYDSDGLSDSWTSGGDVTPTIEDEDIGFHIQKLVFGNSGYISRTISGIDETKECLLQLEVKGSGDLYIYNPNGTEIYHYRIDFVDWKYLKMALFLPSTVQIIFSGSNETLYIDNLVLNYNEDAYNIYYNPSGFAYNLTSRAVVNEDIDGNRLIVEPIKRKIKVTDVRPLWGYCTIQQKEFLESLQGKKIFVRTHDERSFTLYITRINIEYIGYYKGSRKQKYVVALEVEFF